MIARTAQSLLHFAEEAAPALSGVNAKTIMEQLDQHYTDFQRVIQWFIDHDRAGDGLRLANALVGFWLATKRLDEGTVWFDRLLELSVADDPARGRALFNAGYLAFWKGDDERSASLQHQALEIGRRTSDPTVAALALVGLARIALRKDVDAARNLCHEALAVTDGTADRVGRSSALHVLGVAAQMGGDLLEARERMRQRIDLGRETGNHATISIESNNLSMVERQLGNFDEAEALAREALDISHRRGDALSLAWNLNGLAATAACRGELERAATILGAADAAMNAAGGAWPPDEVVHYERTAATLTEALDPAQFAKARNAGCSMTTLAAVDFALGVRSAG